MRDSAWFAGVGGAAARQRIIEYGSADQAAEDLARYLSDLEACGLKPHGEGGDRYYSGNTVGGKWLRVDVEYGKTWTSVVEVQNSW